MRAAFHRSDRTVSAIRMSCLLTQVAAEAAARGLDAPTLLDMIVREALEG